MYPLLLDLLLPFFDDAGIIAVNTYLFSLLDGLNRDVDDGDLPVGDAVSVLRFFVRLVELGVDDVVIQGQDILRLIQASFPSLHASLTHEDFGVDPPVNSRFNYSRFCTNFRKLMVSFNL